MKHTQGEWSDDLYIEENSQESGYVNLVSSSNGYTIASAYGQTYEECEANAKLIAASPIILEALQECRDTLVLCSLIDKSDACKNSIAIAEAAINQATE